MILVLVDTLRADRLGAYGSTHDLTPFLDSFARTATVFRHAYAQAPWTNPSVASLFTSQLPSEHGVVGFADAIRTTDATIAGTLRAAGWETAAFVANGLLQRTAFGHGFDVYESSWLKPEHGERFVQKERAEEVGAAALGWFDSRVHDSAYFVYLHYVEPHAPYSPPADALAHVVGDAPLPDPDAASRRMWFSQMDPPDADALRTIEAVYDAEVFAFDRALRETFTALDARRRIADALVIVTADHGEELLDHAHMGHGHSLYDELIHVPLLVHFPGQTTGTVVDDVVSLVDVAPTVAALTGAARASTWDGRSLAAYRPPSAARRVLAGVPLLERFFRSPPEAERPARSELLRAEGATPAAPPHERAIVSGRWKLIVGPDDRRERYDLLADPREQAARAELPDEDRMAAELAPLAAARAATPGAPAPGPSSDVAAKMRALGYVH